MFHKTCLGILPISLFFVVAGIAAAAEAKQPEVTNWESGVLGDNPYVWLKGIKAVGEPPVTGGEEYPMFVAILEFKNEGQPEAEESVTVAYGVIDRESGAMVTPMKMMSASKSGTGTYMGTLVDANGKRIPDGIYRLLVVMKGKKHGLVLKEGLFPLLVASKAPEFGPGTISENRPLLELRGEPTITSSVDTIAGVGYTFTNADGEVILKEEALRPPGPFMLTAPLYNKDGTLLPPGRYKAELTARNRFGNAANLTAEFEYLRPPPLTASLRLGVDNPYVIVEHGPRIFYSIDLNQNAMIACEHIDENGQARYIGDSTADDPWRLALKGETTLAWNRHAGGDRYYTSGTHRLRVTAKNLHGDQVVAESEPLKLLTPDEVPLYATLKLDPDSILMGTRMASKITYTISLPAWVTLTMYDDDGRVLRKLVSPDPQDEKQHDAGAYVYNLDASKLEEGSYRIVLEARNKYKKVVKEEILSLHWRRY